MSEEHVDIYIIVILPVMAFLVILFFISAMYLTFCWRKDESINDIEKDDDDDDEEKVSSKKGSTNDEQDNTVDNKEEETSDKGKTLSNIEGTGDDQDSTVDNKAEETSDEEKTSSNLEDTAEELAEKTATSMRDDKTATRDENTFASAVCPPVTLDMNEKDDDVEGQRENIEVEYQCQKCGIRNSLRAKIEQHILTVHKKKTVKSASSSVIDETNSTQDRKKKRKKLILCSLCGKRFEHDNEFIEHTKVEHAYSGIPNVKKENSKDGSTKLRKMRIPADLHEKFLQASRKNSQRGIETRGILGGEMKGNEFRITNLIIPPESSNSNIDYGDFVIEQKENLLLLGWIASQNSFSPTYSSLELHKQNYFQSQLPEAIGIMCAISSDRVSAFSLTETGINELQRCSMDPRRFHHHTQKPALYQVPYHMYTMSQCIQINDLRN